MHIRPVELRDAASTASLLNAIVVNGVETSMSEPLNCVDQERYIAQFPRRGVFLVAEIESSGQIVGMQSIEPHGAPKDANGHIAEISTFVAVTHRRIGVGSTLMRCLCDQARIRGFRKIVATIRADNPHARVFYEYSGFRTVGLLKGHARYRGHYLDQLIAERLLVEGDA